MSLCRHLTGPAHACQNTNVKVSGKSDAHSRGQEGVPVEEHNLQICFSYMDLWLAACNAVKSCQKLLAFTLWYTDTNILLSIYTQYPRTTN